MPGLPPLSWRLYCAWVFVRFTQAEQSPGHDQAGASVCIHSCIIACWYNGSGKGVIILALTNMTTRIDEKLKFRLARLALITGAKQQEIVSKALDSYVSEIERQIDPGDIARQVVYEGD